MTLIGLKQILFNPNAPAVIGFNPYLSGPKNLVL